MTARTRIIERVKEVCRDASNKFNVSLDDVNIVIRNCGKAAGWASCAYSGGGRTATDMKLILNAQLVNEEDAHKLIDEVIPHEIAHLVCFIRPELGKNHNRGWANVCRILGGSGERCHRYDLQKARRTRKAVYNINGQLQNIGLTVHKRIQRGASYSWACNKTGSRHQIRREDFTGKVVMK